MIVRTNQDRITINRRVSAEMEITVPKGASIEARGRHPVVQIAYEDAEAYAKWAGKELPTEAEWEYAARGALHAAIYSWGDEYTPGGAYMANTWQGEFPWQNLASDGFEGTAPVKAFPPNGYGLYEMTGNVWEWCADLYADDYYAKSPVNDPSGPTEGDEHSIRGGSWMCAENFCTNYRVAARSHATADSGLNNLGFRCVRDQ